ncbi:MAG: hypothetical protein DRP06_04125 [Candidatus Aenigmatarchaeota archaeon]|nr:MAG: hypothetical protein DRP06_04125 [Candidatus Aenigmarchaeota archaeon]
MGEIDKIRDVLESSETPLTGTEIMTEYQIKYEEPDRSVTKALVNFKEFVIYILGELLEIYPKARKHYGMNPNTKLYFIGDEQLDMRVKKYSPRL